MYYKDLTPYEYYLPFKLSNVLNVGWIVAEIEFTKGDVAWGLLDKLSQILLSEGIFESRVNQIRGVHKCNLCGTQAFPNPYIGSCELWIPSKDSEIYFAAPSLVMHYIQEHGYCPPIDFVESVLQLDVDKEFNGQKIYDELVSRP